VADDLKVSDIGETLRALTANAYELYDEELHEWTTQDGRTYRIQDMVDSHLQNTINYLSRRGYAAALAVLNGSKNNVDVAEATIVRVDEVTLLRYKNMLE
jgi:hypothetical protein